MMRRTEKRRLSAESGFWKTVWSARTCSVFRVTTLRASGSPSSSTVEPSSGAVSPRRTRASVVLPQPDSPTRPSVSPAPIERSTSTRARTVLPSCENVLLAWSRRTRLWPLRLTPPSAGGIELAVQDLGRLVVEVAAARVPVAERVERWLVGAADLLDEAAAVGEDAARQRSPQLRQVAGDRVEAVAVLAQPAARDAPQEPDGVGMARFGEDRLRFALLDQPAGVEDADALAHLADDGEVVADEEDARPELLAQGGDEVEHLRLDGRVQAGGRLVEDEERRVGGQRHGDDHPLLAAAGELVRIAAHPAGGVGDLHLPQDLLRSVERLAPVVTHEPEDLGDLVADPDGGVQRRAGVLVDHRDRRGPQAAHLGLAHGQEVLAVHADRAGHDPSVARQVAHDGERRGRLSAARLADEPVRLALLDRDREPAQHRPVDAADAVDDLEVFQLDGGLCGAHRSKVCARASAIKLMPMISVAIAREGKRTVHQTPALMNV